MSGILQPHAELQVGLFDDSDLALVASPAPTVGAGHKGRAVDQPDANDGTENDPADEPHLWAQDPLAAFGAWTLSRRPYKREFNEHSVKQYASMFGGFLRWLGEVGGKTLLTATVVEIDRFLASKSGRNGSPASATTRRRYLHLIYGVYSHLCEIEVLGHNPAETLVQASRHQDFQRPAPIILSESLMSRYVQWTLAQDAAAWVDARDKALRLVFLATGIAVNELQSLRATDLHVLDASGSTTLTLDVAAHGFVPARSVPVAAFANGALLAWSNRLREIAPASQWLFPARFFGFNVDRPDGTPVSSPECYTIVQTALNAIGYERQRQGPQTLRNSFIAHQIWEGREHHRITGWLGLKTNETVSKIARLVPVRADGVVPA